MKHFYISIILLVGLLTHKVARAQLCDPSTPVFIVDLSGQPNGVWVSPNTPRAGLCCGASSPDICVQFIVTLDSSANGIKFDIISGAVPPGALFYQVSCGPPVQVGEPLCLNGPGPHHLTFCKPGNNSNVYAITSLPQPSTQFTEWVSQACSGYMTVGGLIDTSLTWTSIPPNPVYNSYLSCTSDCDSVTINPPVNGAPAFIDYQVCGYVVGGCFPYFFCDTMRVNFVNNLTVDITPPNPIICFGGPDILITANTSGGLAPFNYLWSTGETTQTIIVGPGTYSVQLQDSMSCSIAYDTLVVTGVPSMILADAGPDQILCTNQQSVQLNGMIQTATGGVWTGGTGTFNPNNTTLNAVYTPSAAEISAGSVQLLLITTGNFTCPADTDIVVITISPSPSPTITGNLSVCEFSSHNYSAPSIPGITYSWTVTGGSIISNNNTSINVLWNGAGAGTISLNATNTLMCDSSIMVPVMINPQPVPIINGSDSVCTSTITQYTIANPVPGNTYAWTVIGGSINGPANLSSLNVSWSVAGNGIITVTESNIYGCSTTVQMPVTVLSIPTPGIGGLANGCAGQSISYATTLFPGNTYNWNVTGGTITAINNNSITVFWPTATNGTVTLTEANTLICDSTVSLNVIIGPQPAPIMTGPTNVCTSTTTTFSVSNPVPGDMYSWSVTGGTISGPSNLPTLNVAWSLPGNGTISVTVSNSFGCDSTVQLPINILTIPTPVISGLASGCAGQSITYSTPLVSGNNYNWNVTGGTITANNNNSITVFWPTATVGTVTLNESNTLTCDSTVSLAVTVGPQPAPILSGPTIVCTSTTTTFSVSNPVPGDMYTWSVTGGTISGPSNLPTLNVAWSLPGNGTISVTVSNSYGCDSTVQLSINILTIPTPVISGLANGCAGQNITYSTPLVSGNSYNWNVTGGTIISNNTNTISVYWPAATSGTVSLTESNTLTCDSTVSLTVIIGPQPAPSVTGAATVCTSTTSTYTVTNPVAGDTYNWNVTGGTIIGTSTGTSVQVQWTLPGAAVVNVNQMNSFGCDSTVSLPVNILILPAPAINGVQSTCAGQTVTYTSNLVQGNTYQWSITGGNIINSNNNAITVQWPSAGNGTVTLTESNTLTCAVTVSINVFTGVQPAPVINGPDIICTNDYSSYGVVVPFVGNTYNWTVTGGTLTGSSNGTSINVLWTSTGLQTITVTEANSSGCDSTITFTVDVRLKPDPLLVGLPVNCEMDKAIYSVQNFPGHTYLWTVTGGSVVGTTVNNSIEVLWTTPGQGLVGVRVISPLGCDSAVSKSVQINPLPTPAISGPPVICENETATYFTALNGSNTYNWVVNGGTIMGSSTTNFINVSFTTPGTANIQLTESTTLGCSRQVPMHVVINDKPDVLISGSSIGCISTQQYNYSSYSQPNVSYQWSVIGGNIISGNGTASVMVQWTIPGNNNITLTATNNITGCDSTFTTTVLTGILTPPVINSAALSGCAPLSMHFNGNSNNPNYNYIWNFGDGTTSTGPYPSHNYASAGTYNIQLIATNHTGCADTTTAVVTVHPNPVSSFNMFYGTDIYYATLSNLTLGNLSSGATHYLWDFGNGDTSTQFEPNYQYNVPGTYPVTLIVTTDYGCSDISVQYIEVKVPEQIYIPNAFSPNSDMVNDYFSIEGLNVISLSISIFNRWGQNIYSSNNTSFKWDGTHNGSAAPEGVYVYKVEAEGFHGLKFNRTGTVTLVR